MRTLWMLLLSFFTFGMLQAQFSKIDSSFLLQFSKQGIPREKDHRLKGIDPAESFFLVKFRQNILPPFPEKVRVSRLLSPQHAIIRLIDLKEVELTEEKVEYIVAANDQWKLPPGNSIALLSQSEKKWIIRTADYEEALQLLRNNKVRVIDQISSTNSFLIETSKSTDILALFHSEVVLFLQPFGKKPKEELLINGFDVGANLINLAHRKYPTINGSGLVAIIKENKFDTADIDFKERYFQTGISSAVVAGHASIMATMLGGGGNSYHLGGGVAWDCQLGSVNFAQLLPESASFYTQFRISVENHSYGTGIENFYGADAAAYDASVNTNSSLVHVFSSGNSGSSTSTSGNYAGIPNFANLTGSFKMAKNIITVGATDSFANIELLSSRGPAFDGRVKPDLVAFGQDGSSGAAALVSGTALLIQHAYKTEHHDSLPPASLVKAAIINAADEVGAPGPDFISGFGSLNTEKAIRSILEGRCFLQTIADKNTQTISLNIPAGIKQLKITLVYSDLAAQPNAFKALVNDLDVELIQVSSGQSWQPWVLSSFPNRDSLLLSASRKRDSLNNVEQISIDNPAAGAYQINVYGYTVSAGGQAYAVVFQADTMDRFEWNFPTKNDAVFAGSTGVARWSETFDGNGRLEFSSNKGTSWQLISSTVDLDKKYFKWQVPDSFTTGLLKMTINGNSFLSDTFVLSKNLQLQVGFNCTDSVLLSWNRVNGADQYQVYALTSKFLSPVALRADTFFVFSKSSINSKHFAVASKQGNAEGLKGYTLNYETQGVACYFKLFLVQLIADKASLNLELGSLYNLKQVEFQKDNGADWLTFQTINNPNQLIFTLENSNLHPGLNRFRVKLVLVNGNVILSQEEVVYYLGALDFIVYPNPAAVANGFKVLRKDLEDATLILYDLLGRKVRQLLLQDLVNPVKTSSLQRGMYFIMILDKNGKRLYTQKVVLD